MTLLAYVSYKKGAQSLHISVKSHDTYTEVGKLIYKANSSFSNVINQEAKKGRIAL